MKNKLLKKMKSSRGETITETLVSLLIIVLAMTMLAGSIVSAGKVNKQVKDRIQDFNDRNNEHPISYTIAAAATPTPAAAP